MQCRDVRSLADAYLDDELLAETNQALLAHLGQCSACRADLKARQELRATLRRAFQNDRRLAPTAEFTTSLRNALCPDVPTPVSGRWIKRAMWLAAAAVLAAVGASGVQWVRDSQRSSATSQTTQIPRAVLQLTEHAAGDHRDCALLHQLPETPIDLAQAASHDGALKGLDEAIQVRPDSLPAPLERRAAHICVWKGQRFGHLVFSYKGEIVSLLVSTPEAGVASFAAGAPAECPTTAGFSIACFADSGRAVFVVSDLPSRETLTLANALSGSVRDHLARAVAALRAWVDRIS
jgi:hypothetical protein